MSSWLAPSVAAEIWGISVDQILAGIADGSIPSYVDGPFLFVNVTGHDIAPTSPGSVCTESMVTEQEIAVLTFQPRDAPPSLPSIDEPPVEQEDENGQDVGSWHTARQESSRTRWPPKADAA